MSTLYRQYRPQRFSELTGQDHITTTLGRAITSGRVAHAYLFYGPRGTGKTTTARLLAKRLNCTQATGPEPCGTCELCVASQSGRNLDLIEIDAASNRGIDDIRALKEGIGLSPTIGTYKVYIIDEVHMLTHEAFTALLKTLEEPVKHALFILATTELHKVPETIRSRCQVYRFKRATRDELASRLTWLLKQEQREIDDAALDFIINRSDGCYRDAESLLGQLLTLHDGVVTVNELTELLGLPAPQVIDDLLATLVAGDAQRAVALIDEVFAAGFDPEQLIIESITRARDLAVAAAKGEPGDAGIAALPGAQRRLPLIIRALLQARQDLTYVPQPLIALHLAILTLCDAGQPAAPPAPPATVAAPGATAVVAATVQAAPATPVPAPPGPTPAKASRRQSSLTAAHVQERWPDVIQAVRPLNPVAATFLRAMKVGEIEGDTIILHAQYALHRNFFTKPVHQKLVAEALSSVLKTSVAMQCVLLTPDTASQSASPESAPLASGELLATVKEVFGQQQ